jgi:probable HAF family extracellular repeat protein
MNVRQTFTATAILAITFGSIDGASAQTARAYKVEDLGTMGGQYLVGLAINNSGEVVGYGYLTDGIAHAFRWSPSDGLQGSPFSRCARFSKRLVQRSHAKQRRDDLVDRQNVQPPVVDAPGRQCGDRNRRV